MVMKPNVGKFDNALDEAIWSLTLDGGPDEEAGSSSDGLWAGLMRDGYDIAAALRGRKAEFPNLTAADISDVARAAGVIITENDQGFVTVKYYESRADLDRDWAEAERELSGGEDFEENAGKLPAVGNFSNISEIKAANRASGGHWFEKGALRFFNSKIEPKVYGGAYFVSSEKFDERSPRKYSVRFARPDGSITTVGEFQAFNFKDDAVDEIKRLLRAGHVPNGRGELSRHRPNTSIADRRKAGIIEGLTREEMDSMEIRIPTFDWKQVGGDMNPGAHGGIIARADGDAIEIIEIQPVREHVGDREAKEVGHPFWSKEGYYDLDDLALSNEGVQSAIEYTGIGEHLVDMTPEQRAVAIAEACLQAGHRSAEADSGWAEDVIGGRIVKWATGETAGYEYIADEDDEFRRDVLELYEVLNGMDTVSFHEEEDDAIEEAKALAEKHPDADITVQQGGSEVWNSADEEEEEELEPNRRRGSHRPNQGPGNPRRIKWPKLFDHNVMDELLDMAAESNDPSGRGHVPRDLKGELSFTDELIEAARAYEDALATALEEVVEKYPPMDGATAEELFDDDAPYLVLMGLMGHGVGIWDGRWDNHYDDTKPVERLLKQRLGKFADDTGGGSIPQALDNAVFEAMERAGYETDDDGYVKKDEG